MSNKWVFIDAYNYFYLLPNTFISLTLAHQMRLQSQPMTIITSITFTPSTETEHVNIQYYIGSN